MQNHIVVFQDQDGTPIHTAFVPHGGKAQPPKVQTKLDENGFFETVFTGWDHDIDHVTENLVVKPVYREQPKRYLVMYYNDDGKMLGMETVLYGQPARKIPKAVKPRTEEYDYVLKGWGCKLDCIMEDTNARAIFEARKRRHTVRFYNEENHLVHEEKVEHGKRAHPPMNLRKHRDKMYHYVFTGWNMDYSNVTESMDIHAVFEYNYNEYPVHFYEDGELILDEIYHYEDEITYPPLEKRGYNLLWDTHPDIVTREMSIRASWEFAYPKGAQAKVDGVTYEILDPSFTNGSVKCVRFTDRGDAKVSLPERVRIGDIFYNVREIGHRAFKACKSMHTLILPKTVTSIDSWGLADTVGLRTVVLNKGLKKLGDNVFAGNQHLREIEFKGSTAPRYSAKTFGRISGQVEFTGPGAEMIER